jgi:hypothetical protein
LEGGERRDDWSKWEEYGWLKRRRCAGGRGEGDYWRKTVGGIRPKRDREGGRERERERNKNRRVNPTFDGMKLFVELQPKVSHCRTMLGRGVWYEWPKGR